MTAGHALLRSFIVGMALVFVCLSASSPAGPVGVDRGYDEPSRVFHSDTLPSLTLPIPEEFTYLGQSQFPLFGKAWVDRHMFADIDNDTIRAIIILQFEGYLDSVKGRYRFELPDTSEMAGSNYRYSPERVKIGSGRWIHNTWAFDQVAGAKDNPEAESAHLLKFLEERGLHLDAELIMSRFAREVGKAQRNELILFYMEPLSMHGYTLKDFPDGGPPQAQYDELSALIVARSEGIFQHLDD